MLLAGDVGGTNTRLGLFTADALRPTLVVTQTFPTRAYSNLESMVGAFLRAQASSTPIAAAAFGAAGPVVDDHVELTNVGWRISAAELRSQLGLDAVALLNDVEAMAYSVDVLDESERVILQSGEAHPRGNGVLIAVGTGLGMAVLHRIGQEFVPLASEAGHSDFAARTARELELVAWARRRFGRVEVERIVSGPGLATLAHFTHGGRCPAFAPGTAEADEPAEVSRAALNGSCLLCRDALLMLVEAIGALAGNLALITKATGGVFLGGGVAQKILSALEWPAMLASFRDKAPLSELLADVPVTVITTEHAGLLGAAVRANTLTPTYRRSL
ncbi:MAG: glucokinase [Vicinamibacterales bacterium]